jgi:hypothetical protein
VAGTAGRGFDPHRRDLLGLEVVLGHQVQGGVQVAVGGETGREALHARVQDLALAGRVEQVVEVELAVKHALDETVAALQCPGRAGQAVAGQVGRGDPEVRGQRIAEVLGHRVDLGRMIHHLQHQPA